MNLGEKFPVSQGKIDALLARMTALGIDARLIEESFVRGGGPGGQKINKTASCVQLRYPPLGVVVRCQRERQRSINRYLALRELVDEIETKVSPSTSRRLQEIERRRRSKARAHRRSKRKNRALGIEHRESSGEVSPPPPAGNPSASPRAGAEGA